ncbi:MAG: type II toxin-antitoxin system VapC family toxin [Candidatus Heimdallarchaeota archaeon]
MEKIVIDASIVAKWFIKEHNSDLALEIRDKFVDGRLELIAPELLPFEVLNALKYSRLFPIEDLKDAATALDEYAFLLVSFNGNYAQKAVKVAEKYDITIYDAAYVGLSSFLNVPAYSADKKLIKRLGSHFSDKIFFLGELGS